MSGYLQFYGETDVVSDVADRINSAGSAYHHTEYWNDADDGEKSHSDMIQDSLNAADARIATLESENAALRHDIERATQRNSDLLAENEALKIVLDGICEHVPNVPYGDLPGEVEALREDAEKMARYIVNHGQDMPDHACAQCVPNAPMLIAGFVCGYHRAVAIDAARKGERNG